MPQPPRRKGRPKGFNDSTASTRIQSLDRALDVLDALSSAKGLTLTELAENLQQSPATLYRVLTTFETRGFVETDPVTQTWHVGSSAFRVGSSFLHRSGVLERSLPEMHNLMTLTGETANLGIERAGQVLFVSQVETSEAIRAFFPPGTMSPMYASGIGKALLSCLSEDQVDRYLRHTSLDAFTPSSIIDELQLKTDLASARQRGWAFDNEEKTTGMRCVASPIFDVQGEVVAGISISGPTSRMPDEKIAEFGEAVRTAAGRISIGLGAETGQARR